MEHVAIDLGARKSQICRRQSDGKIVEEKRLPTAQLGAYLRYLKEPSVVIVESATGAFRIARIAKGLGHTVRVVPATLAPALGVGSRQTKNDVRDARLLSESSCRMELPSVHVPSEASQKRKSELAMREQQVGARTLLINGVRAWLRDRGDPLSSGAAEGVPQRMRKWAERAQVELPPEVTRQLSLIEALTATIESSNKELEAAAKSDPVCRLLETVPGVGTLTALAFQATIDEVRRFSTAHQVQSYLGLTPGEHSSGERERKTSITKAGPPRMRKLLVQAAWTLRRCAKGHPLALWAAEVEKRRGKAIAVVALARKLAGILFAIWRDGSVYNPKRGAAPVPAVEARQTMMKEAIQMLAPSTKG